MTASRSEIYALRSERRAYAQAVAEIRDVTGLHGVPLAELPGMVEQLLSELKEDEMNEKCPACETEQTRMFAFDHLYFVCGNCQFMCDRKDFTRIAAAMELARATAHYGSADDLELGGDEQLGEYVLHSDCAALERRHAELVEAVRWERECEATRRWIIYDNISINAIREIVHDIQCARAAVDALIEDDQKGK